MNISLFRNRFAALSQEFSRRQKASKYAALALIAVATLLPIFRLLYILATTGGDTPSSDDGQFIPYFLGPVLSGTYHWSHFPYDTFQNTHATMAPGLAYIALAALDHLNTYHALYLGVALAGVKLVLSHASFVGTGRIALPENARKDSGNRLPGYLLWPLMALLIFSVSQMSSFEHMFQTFKTAFTELGLALGVWALARFPRRWPAVGLVVIGGLAASFSFANGLMLWPTFLVGMAAYQFRKPLQYACVTAGAALAAWPYLAFLYVHKKPSAVSDVQSYFNPAFLINYLGRPLANNIGINFQRLPQAEWAAVAGLTLVAVCLTVIWRRRAEGTIARSLPAVLFIVFSVLTGLQVGIFRGLVAPWYAAFAMDFWLGLMGLAYVAWTYRRRPDGATTDRLARWSGVAVPVIVLALYAGSNLTYMDKSFFLRTRTPVCVSCIRNYLTAPTYCEGFFVAGIFGFPNYLRELGEPLADHHLSCMGPRQEWSLQGDTILDNVRYHPTAGVPGIWWTADLTEKPVPFTDYRHLNLFLHSPNSVEWTLTVPVESQAADFRSAVAICESAPRDPPADGMTFQVFVRAGEEQNEELALSSHVTPRDHGWRPISLSLIKYAGRRITLRLTSSPGPSNYADWGMYRYPVIDIDRTFQADAAGEHLPVAPVNTDLNPAARLPGPNDLRIVPESTQWKPIGLSPASGSEDSWKVATNDASLEFTGPLDVTLDGYDRFYLTMSATEDFVLRAPNICLKPAGLETTDGICFQLPLLSDRGTHTYTYDLRLNSLNTLHVTGIKIYPMKFPGAGENTVAIKEFGFLKRVPEPEETGQTR